MLSIVFLYAILAIQFPLAKIILSHTKPIFFSGLRLIISGGLLLCISFFLKRDKMSLLRPDIWYSVLYLFIAIFFGIFIANIAEFWSLQYLSAAKAAFFYNLSPLFAALFSYVIFFEKMNKQKVIGLVIALSGVLSFISYSKELYNETFYLPDAIMLIASASMVFGWIYVRKMVLLGFSSLLINGIIMFFGGLLTLLTSCFIETWDPIPCTNIWMLLLYLPIIIVLCNIIGYSIYTFFLKKYTNTFLTLAGCTGPFWAALYGLLFLNETIGKDFFISSVLVTGGLFIFYRQELKQGYII